jgi:hypothetical protein
MKLHTIYSIFATAPLLVLMGCTTAGNVDMPYVKAPDVERLEKATVSYEISYQAPEAGLFKDDELLPKMPISEAKLNHNTRLVVNKFNQILASQLPSNALVVNDSHSDYTLTMHIIATDADGPVFVKDNHAETLLKETLSLGFASNEQDIVADFKVIFSAIDHEGNALLSKEYVIKESIDHEKSDYDFADLSGETLTGKLFEKHVLLSLNDFMRQVD